MDRFIVALCSAFLMLASTMLPQPAHASDAPKFKIVAVDGNADARVLAVRLEARVLQKDLKSLVQTIAASRKKGEKVASLRFYLPGSELSQDPWATAQIDGSEIQLHVLGLRAEEVAQYRAEAQADTRDVVGVWITSPPALPGKLTIFKNPKGGFAAEWHLRSGQKTTDQVTMSRAYRGYRYDVVGGDGAYYLATWSGPLQLGNSTRIIAYGEKLLIEKKPVTAPAPVAVQKPGSPVAAAQAPAATAATGTQQAGTTAAADPAAVAGVPPPAVVPRARRSKAAARPKSRSSVADLMGSSLSR